MSAVLVHEEKNKQLPIYYVSKALLDAETCYSHLENLALALIVAARKLRPYFQAHPIVVVSSFPVKLVLHKPEVYGRLAKCAVELGEYDVIFRPATTIKSQVLADFVAEFAPALLPALEQEVRLRGERIVLTLPTGNTASRAVRCNFKTTSNESEYEALIAGLTLAHQMGAENIQIFGDSQLIINQNSKADALANLGASLETNSQMSIPLLMVQLPATMEEPTSEEVSAVKEGETWMTPLIWYLEADILPKDRGEAIKIKKQAARYCIAHEKLYQRSFSGPYLRSVTPREAARILVELHEGDCGSHSSGRSLVLRARGASYYWPTMAADTDRQAKHCDQCQRHPPVSKLPPENRKSIGSPLPFKKWGMDIVGKFPMAPGQKKSSDGRSAEKLVLPERRRQDVQQKVRTRTFQQGDWVLRRAEKTTEKLTPGWEGHYKVIEVRRAGAYRLQDSNGKIQPNCWNALHLKAYQF
ncbi:PREDICTED: uncharacterized protein LOC106314631 [Brassica oleracea var. oleracea]|uniref:uncharacterized protein LOC106314631 n=1 Tax=Brassica oleracea var. oleracea TaxID=109376 RepID=UPI0006A6B219|nr:PREDICTED: uncharacterized protein LOC106314631 [Brassica oleracea var. oleracea]